jgi:membrane protease YdiL (CAAX protease family)
MEVVNGFVSKSTRRSRRRDLFELVVGYVLILAVIWSPHVSQHWLYWVGFAFIIGSSLLRRDLWRESGLGLRGTLPSLWVVVAALTLAALAVMAARDFGTYHPLYSPPPFLIHVSGYVIWAFLQQFILQAYVLLRLLRLGLTPKRAVVTAAVMFTCAHIPNPVLMPLTLVWGLISCVLFLRYRNLYTLGLAHGILGICIAVTVPNAVQHHMRVGLGYLHYHPHHARPVEQRPS